MCSKTIIINLLYPTLLLLTICKGGKSMENMSLKDEGNANTKFMDSMLPHFQQFGKPFEPLEEGKDHIIKKNMRTGKVEWRLAEIKRNWKVKIDEFSMLDEIDNEEKVLSHTMMEYANCIKNEKLKIPKDKETKIFMLSGTITIPDMKRIAGKRNAYLAEFVTILSDYGQQQKMEVLSTHFCTSLFIAKKGEKIGEPELICTRIGQWIERNSPPNFGKKTTDCGHSMLYDSKLDIYFSTNEEEVANENFAKLKAEKMLEFIQIKLAMDLSKMLKRIEAANNSVESEKRKHKKNDKNMPTASAISADEYEKMDPNIRIYTGFMCEYNPRKMVAHWLLERLTIENVSSKNQIERPKLKWNADPKLAQIFQPDEGDYQTAFQFKLNHGHLAGYRAHRINDEHETFLYPNSLPQDREINSGYWRVIEEYAICLAGHKKSVAYVYNGPLYIPEMNTATGQWQMKYKVLGKRKMMAVPTHLFKTILLEFKNDNGKKSYWLETFVVSNGQEGEVDVLEEENVDLIKEENIDGRQEEAVEEEEEDDFIVELGEGDNVYYVLSKNEAEINELLEENLDNGKEKATTSKVAVDMEKISQKLAKGKGKKIPAGDKVYINKTDIDNIQALVQLCQNIEYKINYGDKKKRPISDLLGQHRKPLTYIDKFAPNFKLLAKLPVQLRAGKKESERKGVHFDEDILAKLMEENEKRKDKGKRKKLDKGKRKRKDKSTRKQFVLPIKDMVEESGNSSNDEKEGKRKAKEGGEGEAEAKSFGEKFAIAAGGAKGKKGKNIKKGDKKNNKQPRQKQKHQHQQQSATIAVNTATDPDEDSSTENTTKSETKFYEVMEKLYTGYLLNSNLRRDEEEYLFDSIILQTLWHEIHSLLQSVMTEMLADGNTIGAKQIVAIRLEFYKDKEMEDMLKLHSLVDLLYMINLEEIKKFDEGNICLLTHLRESIFYTYLSASSRRQKSNNLRNFALEFEQKRWREFSLFPETKGEEEYNFSNNVDGKIIAQIWMEKANWCYDENEDINKYVYKYKLERQNLLFSTLQKLLNEKQFLKKLKQFLEENDNKSIAIYTQKLMRILGVHQCKKFFKEFSNLTKIESQLPELLNSIFREAIFDVVLVSGYQSIKYRLQEFLYFFGYYAIMDGIEHFAKEYNSKMGKFKDKSNKRTMMSELRDIKNLKNELTECHNLESTKISASMCQALVIRCIRDVYCQWQNLYFKVNFLALDERKEFKRNLHFFGGEECDGLIRMHGNIFSEAFEHDPNASKKFYKQFTEIYDESTRSLIKWSFNREIKTDEQGNIAKLAILPNYDLTYRETLLSGNEQSENYVANWMPFLLEHNWSNWQILQSKVAASVTHVEITLLLSALQSSSNKISKMTEKGQTLDALNAFQNEQKILTLEKMFKQIVEKIEKNKNNKPLKNLCQYLILRQHLHFLIENMDDEEQKNNQELQKLIQKYGQIHKSSVPFDEGLSTSFYVNATVMAKMNLEIAAGMLITVDGLEKYCENKERIEILFRKHRQELENMVANQLNMIFFTDAFGNKENYHLVMDLPAKLIKIAGISGFMNIVRNHPLIMTNFFNMETVSAIQFHLEKVVEEKENQKEFFENIERAADGERKKHHIMLDSILFQLKFPLSKAGEQENVVITNKELEKRNKIERAKTEGMDILMEWLDNSNLEKAIKKMKMSNEEMAKQNELDEMAYSAIGQLIIGTEHTISGLEEIDPRENANSATAKEHVEKWRKQWRKHTLTKLMELEEGKEKSDDKKEKGKGKID